VNRPRRKRELEVRVMFEPDRFTQQYMLVAYERVVPIRRRSTRVTKEKERSNHWKVAYRAGGGL
jgi:hypothetical protein